MNIILLERKPLFVFGFVISFIGVFLFEYSENILRIPVFYEDDSIETFQNLVQSLPKTSDNYEIWRKNQNVRDSKINLDEYLYKTLPKDASEISQTILEADWLKRRISITCIVFVKELKLAIAIKNTWGKHCNHLLFFSENLSDLDLPVINLGTKYSSSWHVLCEAMNHIWNRKNELQLQWIIFVKDDTFVISENLRFLVASLDFQKPYYLGHTNVLWGLSFNAAPAGYVLSYEALHKLMKIFNTPAKCFAGGKLSNKDDYSLATHLRSLEIYPSDTRDYEQRGTFHEFSLSASYLPRPECCSKRSVTFNVESADKMLNLYYTLYHLYVFEKGTFGNRQAPTPIPDNEFWKLALRKEFNLTIIDEISSDQYFQIWRSKYVDYEEDSFHFRFSGITFGIILLGTVTILNCRSKLRILPVWYIMKKRNNIL